MAAIGGGGVDMWSQLGDFFGKAAEGKIKQYKTRKGLQAMGIDPIKAEGLSNAPENILRTYITNLGKSSQKQQLGGSELVDRMFSRRFKDLQGDKVTDESTSQAAEQSRSNVISQIQSGTDPETAISGGIKNVNKIKVGNQILEGNKFNPSKTWTEKGKQEDITKASKNIKPLVQQGVYSQADAVQKMVEAGWSEEDAVLATAPELTDNVAGLIFNKAGKNPQKAKKLAMSYGFKVPNV